MRTRTQKFSTPLTIEAAGGFWNVKPTTPPLPSSPFAVKAFVVSVKSPTEVLVVEVAAPKLIQFRPSQNSHNNFRLSKAFTGGIAPACCLEISESARAGFAS